MAVKSHFMLCFKGVFMGICDLIPGVSGGTVAFITGIYTRLINAVKGFSPELVYSLFIYGVNRDKENLKRLKQSIRKLDLGFLIILFFGIISAILLGSQMIKFLLGNYLIYTLSFFVGLIIASCFIIFEDIKNHKFKNILFGFLGFVVGISFAFLMPVETAEPSLYYIFVGGFFAISAMFLPGISGSFILLIMGLYEFIIHALGDIWNNRVYLAVFVAGVGLGVLVISRVISFLFRKDKCKTLYFLLGLVVGSLNIPVRKIFGTGLGTSAGFIMVFFFLIGILLVLILRSYRTDFLED